MSLPWKFRSSGIWRWIIGSVWFPNVLKEHETLRCWEAHTQRQWHITVDLNLLLHRRDSLQSHMSLSCYKGPHTMLVTFVVWCLWSNWNREWENMFVNWKWLPLVGLYDSFIWTIKLVGALLQIVVRNVSKFTEQTLSSNLYKLSIYFVLFLIIFCGSICRLV